jgi:hypothetical protein
MPYSLPSLEQLYSGEVPIGYISIKDGNPETDGRYETLDSVGSVSAKIQKGRHLFKTDHRGWQEGDWVKVLAWKPQIYNPKKEKI